MMIDEERLLLEAGPNELGVFFLQKCMFIIEGENANSIGRCENMSYGGIGIAVGTKYEKDSWENGVRSNYDDFEVKTTTIEKWGHVISVVPHFFIDYLQMKHLGKDGSYGIIDIQTKPTPMSMWLARSIYQCFKNMREWSFMVDDPFNSDHPMALYSKMAYDMLQPPQDIVDEIDSMPDMHLAKFLKGDPNYRLIPEHPRMSQNFKSWIIETCNAYREPSFEQRLDAVLND